MSHIKGFFKKITGDTVSYDALAKQPIIDAENKLNLFKDATGASITALENYQKFMQKTVDLQLSEKFFECKELFKRYESKGDSLSPNIAHVLGIIFGKLQEAQYAIHTEVVELVSNIDNNVIRPLIEYQKEISIVRDNRKELKDAYDRIDQCRTSLDKAKREVDNVQKSGQRMIMGTNDSNRRLNDLNRLEDKVQRLEKDLDDANSSANEKYDKYTEGLFKRVADECDLSNYYLEYLKLQRKYHKQALKRIDSLIPEVKDSLKSYNKRPVFGCSLVEYVNITNSQTCVSPVIKKLIESMCKQNVFNEEGIFRVAGSRIKMNCILYAINAGYLEYLDTNNDFDVHCLAGVLKQYIRELPDSILCNERYDDWINAINTPMPKKLEVFKQTLQQLPKENYENLRYLIKFLSKIVENSDKTKMNTTNMGICFGVSLLSSTKTMNTSNSINNMSSQTQSLSQFTNNSDSKSIDMATATNVFDFLLTNHHELLPGDINFLNGTGLTTRQSFHQTNTRSQNIQNGEHSNFYREQKSNLNTSYEQTHSTHSNRYSVMVNDSFNSLNEGSITSPFIKQQQNTSFVSPSPSSSLTNVSHVNRHIKNNSMDIKFLEQDSNQAARIFPSLATQQANSNSTISLDSGSSSPKLKSKKQAPAPPKTDTISQIQTSPIETVNEETSDSQSPLSTSIVSVSSVNNLNTLHGNFATSKQLINNSETSLSSATSTSSNTFMTKLSTSSETTSNETVIIAPTAPARTSSFKHHDNSFSLEKPNQPPPQVPVRTHIQHQQQQQPPPIGFNIGFIDSEPNGESDSPPFPTNKNQSFKTDNLKNKENINSSSLSSSTSSTSSLVQDSPSMGKPPKPILPRRLGNGIAAQLNKFEKKLEEDVNEERQDKSPSEVTSL